MRLLLTHGYFLEEDAKEREIMKPYAPLGILYLSSYLRAHGFQVDLYDSTFGSKPELFQVLETAAPGAIGIYATLMTRANVVEIAARARELGWRVILGGPEPANYAAEYLDSGAEVIVAGEGERALEILLRSEMDPSTRPSIPGILFRDDNGSVVKTQPAAQIEDLDAQPWPDRERIDLRRYLNTWRARHGQGSVSLITARGCPYHCNWCSHSVYGKTHRRRSPSGVVDEVEWILSRYQPDMLWLADDVFTIHYGWLFEYAAEMKRRSLRIPFECITRADRITPRVAATLAELGCFRVWIGSESGSQRILDAMRRGVSVTQVREAVRLAKAAGIATGMFLMWGYDGEELQDIEATVDHVKQCRPDVCFTTVTYPIKGTEYFQKVASRLVNIQDWRGGSDRNLRIGGQRSNDLYKLADDFLRRSIDLESDPAAIHTAHENLQAAWSRGA